MDAPTTTIDLERLTERCRRARPDLAIAALRPLHGGASSLTFVADSRPPVVVRAAPPGLVAAGDRDVLRQARMMQALRTLSDYPVPAVLATIDGEDGEPPAFIMAFVAGDPYEPIMEGPAMSPGPAVLRDRALAAARALGTLHRLSPTDLGADHDPVFSPVDDLARWRAALATALIDGTEDAASLYDALAAAPPPPMPPAIVHGDFRLGNLICRGAEVRAVLDWEAWSVSDPRIDLAYFLSCCECAGQPLAVWEPDGMPAVAELQAAYRGASGAVEVADLRWFEAAGRYRQAAITARVVKHNRRRPDPDPGVERHAASIAPLLRDGRRLLDEHLATRVDARKAIA
jgi:aminoglycoside phosphotransferase (APT) family kinase protein